MERSGSRVIAIGGGELAESREVLDRIFELLRHKEDARVLIMTVATNEVDGTYDKYDPIFRKRGVKHVEMVDVSAREDGFDDAGVQKIERADCIFFTGGDQLNITSLFGGSPLHDALVRRVEQGVVVAGTSAGAAMMSSCMIVEGRNDEPPKAECLNMGPGLDLIASTIIDTHFSQRGRHGRLLTAIAHYPQYIGLGIDPLTAIEVYNGGFKVLGSGSVTIIDAARMSFTDLAYKKRSEPFGMFDVTVHVLPREYTYDLKSRQPAAPENAAAV